MTVTIENVKISNIEQELQTTRAAASENMTRACLFNLIIYTHEERRTNYFQELVLKVIERFPCRIFFIQGDRNSTQNQLKTSLSTRISGNIICEQITLYASGKGISRVPYTILPLLIPDLPIYLIWGQNPTQESEILPHLQQFATSLIFDSECMTNLKQFSQAIIDKTDSLGIEVVDMNWTRIRGWREAIAKTFDTLEKINQLSNCTIVQINYNNKPSDLFYHQEIQPIYLQAWLASQMNWTYQSMTKIDDIKRITYKTNNNQTLIVDLCPKALENLPAGSILAVEVISKDQHLYTIARKDSTPYVTICISSKETCDLPITMLLPNQQRTFSFIKDIFYGSCGGHYIKMLKTIAQQDYPL